MEKDYAKFIPPKKRSQSKTKGSAYFFIFLFVMVLLGAGGGYFLYVKQPAALFSKEVALLAHKKNLLNVKPVKKLTQANAAQAPEVQFDFYSELPNMQVTFSEPGAVAKSLTQLKAPSTVKIEEINSPEIKTASIKAEDIDELPELNAAAPASRATNQPDIFNTDELKTLLDAESQSSAAAHYVIQLGVFESEAAAARLLAAINAVGFEGNVVKSPSGYRVQQGPYASKELAKLTQQRLQKRGIISIIRKLA
jgi:cell division protein FtsN